MPEETEEKQKVGVQNLGEIIDFAGDLGEAGGRVLEDNQLGLSDLRHVLGLRGSAVAAIQDADEVVDEVKDIDLLELDELITKGEAAKGKIEFFLSVLKNFKQRKEEEAKQAV